MFKKVHIFRVRPGEELAGAIATFCQRNDITSAVILGIIGSATSAHLNYLKELPGKYETIEYVGPLEIVAAQGSIALRGRERLVHIHIQLANTDGSYGGHLVQAKVFSTAEVVIGELDYQLHRYSDEQTGLNELQA